MPYHSKKKRKTSNESVRRKCFIQRNVTAKAPTSSSCELPILGELVPASARGLPAREVIRLVCDGNRLFTELTDEDLQARYPNSRRKITETRIKYARKNLVLKEEIYPVDEVNNHPSGIWQITAKGFQHFSKDHENWKPKYTIHKDAIIFVEDEIKDSGGK